MGSSYRELDYAYGDAMKTLRNVIGLTQDGLANKLGVSWRTVAGWEAGSRYARAEHLKKLIALAVQRQAFSVGHEAKEIHALWKVAHQKILLDEHWLSALLDQQSRLQEQAQWPQSGVEPEPMQETVITAQVIEQESADEGSVASRTTSEQSSLLCSWPLTGLDAATRQQQGQSQEQLPEAGTTGTLSPLPDGNFLQTPSKTKANQPRRQLLIGILIAFVIGTITGSAGTLFFQTREQAHKTAATQVYPSYLSGNGTLAFFDPLNQEGKWHSESDPAGELCQFIGGALHVIQAYNGYFGLCLADGIFGNFAFEVQLTITQGDCGGMTFRDDSNGHFYTFFICQDGTCTMSRHVSDDSSTVLQEGSNLAIRSGLGQQNKMAVVVSGSTIIFYVNEQQIGQAQDSGTILGKIALVASPVPGGGHATDVAYSNARLWTL